MGFLDSINATLDKFEAGFGSAYQTGTRFIQTVGSRVSNVGNALQNAQPDYIPAPVPMYEEYTPAPASSDDGVLGILAAASFAALIYFLVKK